jgi:hypothetical protein
MLLSLPWLAISLPNAKTAGRAERGGHSEAVDSSECLHCLG